MLAQNFILREMGFFEFLRSMGFFAPSVQAQNFILRARNSLLFKTNDFLRPMGFLRLRRSLQKILRPLEFYKIDGILGTFCARSKLYFKTDGILRAFVAR